MRASTLWLRIAAAALCLGSAASEAHAQRLSFKSAVAELNSAPLAVPTSAVLQAASQPLEITAQTDKLTYRDGERVELTVQSEKAGHVRIFYRDVEGQVSTLFPFSGEKLARAIRDGANLNDRIPGGRPVLISGEGSITGISVRIGGPHYGKEQIAVLVTDFPLREDAALLAELKRLDSATDAAKLTAGLAVRQDFAQKSASVELNPGRPALTSAPLTKVGIFTINITTRP